MPRLTVQDVVVTEVTGDDLTVAFSLQTLAQTTPQGFVAYKAPYVISRPHTFVIPDPDDLLELIFSQPVSETVTEPINIEFPAVHLG